MVSTLIFVIIGALGLTSMQAAIWRSLQYIKGEYQKSRQLPRAEMRDPEAVPVK